MIAVIFEVEPHPEHKARYLDIAAELKPELETIEGFLSVERFQSLTNPGKILSLSFFRDEKALSEWRNRKRHRDAQREGRGMLFQHYRLRIASVIRDYGLHDRNQAPTDALGKSLP